MYILFFVLLSGCSRHNSTPRPNGYMRIDLPEKAYRLFDSTGYPYRFECPACAQLIPDTESVNYEPFWINMRLPAKATLHLSYKRINNNLSAMLDDTYNFVYRHVIKADAIVESSFQIKEKKVSGIIYEIGGNTAIPCRVKSQSNSSSKNSI